MPVPAQGMFVPIPADGMIVPVCTNDPDHADGADRNDTVEDECPVDVRNDRLHELGEDDDQCMMTRKLDGRLTVLLCDDSTSRKDVKLEDVMTVQPIGMPYDDGRRNAAGMITRRTELCEDDSTNQTDRKLEAGRKSYY